MPDLVTDEVDAEVEALLSEGAEEIEVAFSAFAGLFDVLVKVEAHLLAQDEDDTDDTAFSVYEQTETLFEVAGIFASTFFEFAQPEDVS